MSNQLRYIIIALIGGGLMALGWPPLKLPYPLFMGLVPFLVLEHLTSNQKHYGKYVYLGLFTFNLISTWWVWNASPGGAVFMLFANSFLMLLPFLIYRRTKRLVGESKALIFFVISWISFEHFHFRWDLAYPWLTLGNGFASSPELVQWYEYTGAQGGSLWIILINVFLFKWVKSRRARFATIASISLILPTFWSMYLGSQQTKCPPMKSVNVSIIQPNIDPYHKFDNGSASDQIRMFTELAEEATQAETDLLIFPETALTGNHNEENIQHHPGVRAMRGFQLKHPQVDILIGASTHRFYKAGEELPKYPRYYEPTNEYYDSYNTALQINSNGSIETYHKSRLVPGVESMPFPRFFKLFDNLLKLDFGGVSGNLGSDKEAKSFHYSNRKDYAVAPLICYESVFGDYVGDFVAKKADFLAVITNDGWWGNTAGHKQHKDYARLRAIEYRRYVVRSANTGISCVIDDNGNVLDELGWWKKGYLQAEIPALPYTTYYAKTGDYLGRIAQFIFLFFGLSLIVKVIRQRNPVLS